MPRHRHERAERLLHNRRVSDMRGWPRARRVAAEFWYELVPLLALMIAGVALWLNSNKADKALVRATAARQLTVQQAEGRKIAIDVICGYQNGLGQAVRATFSATTRIARQHTPTGRKTLELLRFLQAHGGPSLRERDKQARQAAAAFLLVISRQVAKQAGANAKHVVRSDGTMNCTKLRKAARAGVSSSP